MPQGANLYGPDFFAWTEQQATALRRLAERRINLEDDLDLDNLIEEVESMGRSDLKAVTSALARVIEHLLKLEYSGATDPRDGWITSVDNHRGLISDEFTDSPSLRGRVDPLRAWTSGRASAIKGLRRHEPAIIPAIPADCPYTPEQLLDDDWYPVNRHGLT